MKSIILGLLLTLGSIWLGSYLLGVANIANWMRLPIFATAFVGVVSGAIIMMTSQTK